MTRLDEELGVVRLCARCDEWWPDDEDFYETRRSTICRACHDERRAARRAGLAEAARRYRARRRTVAA